VVANTANQNITLIIHGSYYKHWHIIPVDLYTGCKTLFVKVQ